MIIYNQNYSLFFEFIKTFAPTGFKGIDRNHPLVQQLETITEYNDQFFYIADLIQLKVIFTSLRSNKMIGIEPEEVTPYHFMEATHPNDIQRLNLGRSKLIKMAQDLFIAEHGYSIISTDYLIRNPTGEYSNLLIQGYLFCTSLPYKTVFFLKIHTNIDWYKKKKHGFHYYLGNNLSNFRYPDEKLLSMGHLYSDREFEIIRLIEAGFSSEQVAEKLFLSQNTVNTHRRNILKKAGKAHISDLIYALKSNGLL
jgi:DNA-binding CsgD family transcriptional regulator